MKIFYQLPQRDILVNYLLKHGFNDGTVSGRELLLASGLFFQTWLADASSIDTNGCGLLNL